MVLTGLEPAPARRERAILPVGLEDRIAPPGVAPRPTSCKEGVMLLDHGAVDRERAPARVLLSIRPEGFEPPPQAWQVWMLPLTPRPRVA